ncbi:MAG: hypothetical protein ACT4NX_02220 [Deltaproteobacteria bacterium]
MNFEDEIRKIANANKKNSPAPSPEAQACEPNAEMRETLGALLNLATLGAHTYNEISGAETLSAHEISEEILGLMINSAGATLGFCLIGRDRFAVFLISEANEVLALGKKKDGSEGIFKNARQLIKLSAVKSGGRLMLEAASNPPISPEELIVHIVKWVSS